MALERALASVVERHDALRTTLPAVDGAPRQAVAPHLLVPLPVADLGALPEDEREPAAAARAAEEAAAPFDLAGGPLLRARLLRLGHDDHVIVLVAHHAICDGWSMRVLFADLAACYDAHREQAPAALPALPLQYADYAAWQRRALTREALERRLAYWRQALDGAPRVLELPTDLPRPPVQRFRGRDLPVRVAPAVVRALRALGRREGATAFTVLLAAFQAFLHRLTGQTDLLIGVPVAGRERPEVEGLVGLFVNTLVVRGRVDAQATFRELLAHARETILDATDHADLPFDLLIEHLQPERDLTRGPLVQVMLAYQEHETALTAGELTLRPFPVDKGTSTFDLLLSLDAHGDELVGALTYNTDVLAEETAARWAGWFARLLAGAVAAPDTPPGGGARCA